MIVSTPTPATRGLSDRCACYSEMQPGKLHVATPASQRGSRARLSRLMADGDCLSQPVSLGTRTGVRAT